LYQPIANPLQSKVFGILLQFCQQIARQFFCLLEKAFQKGLSSNDVDVQEIREVVRQEFGLTTAENIGEVFEGFGRAFWRIL
jgi:hypothetical protein